MCLLDAATGRARMRRSQAARLGRAWALAWQLGVGDELARRASVSPKPDGRCHFEGHATLCSLLALRKLFLESWSQSPRLRPCFISTADFPSCCLQFSLRRASTRVELLVTHPDPHAIRRSLSHLGGTHARNHHATDLHRLLKHILTDSISRPLLVHLGKTYKTAP